MALGVEGKAFLPYITIVEPIPGLVMSTLTVTAKGQVTLRKDLLEHLGVHPGEKITVNKLPDGRIEVRAARPTGKISDAFGFLKRDGGPSLSIEEINEIIANGWAGKR
jgi:AbrB family looped-hinge helix DNA binding protein